jgi:type II secretory ATPase GspE/PulE/Tfp pilus assembly ATPase PilB-like protein
MSTTLERTEFEDVNLNGSRVGRTFTQLIRDAAELPASDLYFNWNERDVTIFVRHLGILRRWSSITRDEGSRFVNYVKASAGMDLAQRLRPLDGRWISHLLGGQRIDLRISTIPTLHGEDMSIRLLQRHVGLMKLENLGFHPQSLAGLRSLLRKPSGLVLLTGPASTGKTTTLYACLTHLNDGTRKINTIEDPVEYSLEGIRQSQVNPKIELGFPELLRSVLRQTPDVIMVGEVRDPITAETVVRAANSGHLVFATLHAPVAAGAVESMLALGVAPHFLATSLLGILSQRLVRVLCEHCKVPLDVGGAPGTFESVRKWLKPEQGARIYGAAGCERCHGEGYSSRSAVVEVLRGTKQIRRMIFQKRSARDIQDVAIKQGMLDLRSAGLLRVAEGLTSTDEMVRLIPSDQVVSGD